MPSSPSACHVLIVVSLGKLMLASASQSRRMLMENAGLQFEAEAAHINERAAEAGLGGNPLSPDRLALELARGERGGQRSPLREARDGLQEADGGGERQGELRVMSDE